MPLFDLEKITNRKPFFWFFRSLLVSAQKPIGVCTGWQSKITFLIFYGILTAGKQPIPLVVHKGNSAYTSSRTDLPEHTPWFWPYGALLLAGVAWLTALRTMDSHG